MATSFSGGRSRSTRRKPPTMGKQLVKADITRYTVTLCSNIRYIFQTPYFKDVFILDIPRFKISVGIPIVLIISICNSYQEGRAGLLLTDLTPTHICAWHKSGPLFMLMEWRREVIVGFGDIVEIDDALFIIVLESFLTKPTRWCLLS